MEVNIPIITSITAIIVAVVGIASSFLAYRLGKQRLRFDSNSYQDEKQVRDASVVSQFSSAAKSAADSLEKAMVMNKTLQEEIATLKAEVIQASLILTEKSLLLTTRVEAVESNLTKASAEIATLLKERSIWMDGARLLYNQLTTNKLEPEWELPITERRVSQSGLIRRRKNDNQ